MKTLLIAATAAASLMMSMNSAMSEDQRNPVWDIYPSYQLSINSNLPRSPVDGSSIARGGVSAPQVTGSIGVARPSTRVEPGAVDLREWQLHNSAR